VRISVKRRLVIPPVNEPDVVAESPLCASSKTSGRVTWGRCASRDVCGSIWTTVHDMRVVFDYAVAEVWQDAAYIQWLEEG